MTLRSEKVNRKKQKMRKKRHGAASHFLRYHAVPSGKSRRRRFAAIHMPIKMKGVCLYGICIRCRICFPLCAVVTKTHSFRPTYWGKKPAGKLCARINLNCLPGLLRRGVETVCPAQNQAGMSEKKILNLYSVKKCVLGAYF